MIWIVLAFIFSNALTGLYCYLKGLAKAFEWQDKNKTEEQKEDEEKRT